MERGTSSPRIAVGLYKLTSGAGEPAGQSIDAARSAGLGRLNCALVTKMLFTAVLHRDKIACSMDGCGASRDNVFGERLWRSVKYEEANLQAMAWLVRPAPRSAAISSSTTGEASTRCLTAGHPIRSTLTDRF